MLKKMICTFVLSVAMSQASVKELIPALTSDDLNVQTRARLDLLVACSKASSPDASEADRKAICLEICSVLESRQPVITVIQPMLNNLERIAGEESVPTLVRLLNHSDEHIRNDACRALVVNPSPAAAQALGVQLKSRKAHWPEMTAGLIYALGERRQEGASGLIVSALKSTDQGIFIAAVQALGLLNEDLGVKGLLAQREQETGLRKTQIDAALLASDRTAVYEKLVAAGEPQEVRSAALLGLILAGDSERASGAITSNDIALQLAVIEAARQGKNARVLDAVAEHINTLAPRVQVQALGALEFSGNQNYARVVEPFLESDNQALRDNAARALARIGTKESAALLLALGSKEALRALGQLDVEPGVLEDHAAKGSDSHRAAAIQVLSDQGRTDLVPVFLTYATEDGKEVSTAAVKAIGQNGDLSSLEPLTQLLIAKEASWLSRDILLAIVQIMRRSEEQGKAVDILVSLMDGSSPRSQAHILKALVQTESTEALKPLAAACRSKDEALKASAVKMLAGWKNDNGVATMIEVASDKSLPMGSYVMMMRGVSRLLAGQSQLDTALAEKALAACRRPEDRQMIQAVTDK